MALLREMELVRASVPAGASFLDAARTLLAAHTSALAVLDENERVVGLFTDDDVLQGCFPRYLAELHHTAFLDEEALQARIEAAGETVSEHMREPVTVELDSSSAHVVERFLHTPWGAIAVVDERGRFAGMLGQIEFTERLLTVAGIDTREP